MGKRFTRIVPPFDSLNLTKGKEYPVLADYGDSIFSIKNDANELITVCAGSSAWTYGSAWLVLN